MRLFILSLCACILFTNCTNAPKEVAIEVSAEDLMTQSVARGEYLIHTMGCNDCHTPKKMTDMGPALDESLLLSGHPAAEVLPTIADKSILQGYALFTMGNTAAIGPWGTSFAANLTPDESGIGNWTFEQFETALTKGKNKGLESGRPLLPPMPWQNYINIKQEDLLSMFDYLKSIKPVMNVVPAPIPPMS